MYFSIKMNKFQRFVEEIGDHGFWILFGPCSSFIVLFDQMEHILQMTMHI